ncbi:MAG: GGDEF domain-containing protein [Oscillospiraceae bacterium]|nr:GGDEF domain-containing protein [Oscillospiraceae bacterium]
MARRKGFDLSLRRDKTIRRVSRMYGILGVVLVVVTLVNMLVQNAVYVKTRDTLNESIQSIQMISEIQNNFTEANENVLKLFSSIGTPEAERVEAEAAENVASCFSKIQELSAQYKELKADAGDDLKRRFEHAEYAISAYQRKILDINQTKGSALTHEESMNIYNQELAPLQLTAAEMLQATVKVGTKEGQAQEKSATAMRAAAQLALTIMLVLTIIALYFIGRSQINSIIEIKQKEQEITEAGNRLTKSKKKLMDSAMTNILTGMKNRYALDESLSQLIGNAQFNIAVFDIDNFRMINDMYGYEFGDEYLATVAERLKDEYSEYAEMFNISGNEFCMVFYEHVSDLQAQQLAEQIRQGIGQPTLVANIPVQTTVSSSLYHYLPSDNLDVNTLLMKMDSALHAAKRDGGNRMYQIQ